MYMFRCSPQGSISDITEKFKFHIQTVKLLRMELYNESKPLHLGYDILDGDR